ncbi:MAG TPA: hypothetical protein VK589_12720 [Chryseolinea sp.]|nr:hypothetical protein [Chryseolinea sp.]
MEARVSFQSAASPAKDLSNVVTVYFVRIIAQGSDGSLASEFTGVLICFVKPIPLAQLYDKDATALEDSIKGG